MIKSAGERFKSYSNALFINSSFQDIFKNKKIIGKKFDTVIIAGMGGLLTIRILEAGLKVLQSVSECSESAGRNARLWQLRHSPESALWK